MSYGSHHSFFHVRHKTDAQSLHFNPLLIIFLSHLRFSSDFFDLSDSQPLCCLSGTEVLQFQFLLGFLQKSIADQTRRACLPFQFSDAPCGNRMLLLLQIIERGQTSAAEQSEAFGMESIRSLKKKKIMWLKKGEMKAR